mmetsp:Transcript_15256/g.36553  ORF Transcript_15256/g.36553 Transcript_15256/m.36553 type:complete len:129 (+) Transcript_15256:1229-1615(+)
MTFMPHIHSWFMALKTAQQLQSPYALYNLLRSFVYDRQQSIWISQIQSLGTDACVVLSTFLEIIIALPSILGFCSSMCLGTDICLFVCHALILAFCLAFMSAYSSKNQTLTLLLGSFMIIGYKVPNRR